MTGILQLLLGQSSAAPAYQIQRSLRFNSADSAYLDRTPSSTTNRRTWTFSCWAKLCYIPANSGEWYTIFGAGDYASANASYTFQVTSDGGVRSAFFTSSAYNGYYFTNNLHRDLSAWYHFVVSVDTTQATASNRVKMYANNLLLTGSAVSDVAQNYDTGVNLNQQHYIGAFKNSSIGAFGRQYLTEINFIDGQALTPSSFGETNANTGVWQPKAYTGTYGTNGFYVNFSDNSNTTSTTLGKDYSGNSNNWTPNNFSVTAGIGNDSLTDTPTAYGTDTGVGGELRGNFCTLNLIGPGAGTIANGNLQYTAQDNYGRLCTFGLSTGKWYWESTATATEYFICGLISQAASYGSLYDPTQASGYNDYGGYPGPCYGINISGGGTSYKVDQTTATTYGPQVAPVNGDVFMFAVDFDAGKFWVGKNGTWMASGDPVAGTNATWSSMTATTYFVGVHGYGTPTQYLNFGQRPFAYTAPSGFKCMAVQNFSTPTIGATSSTRADDYFNTLLWTGNGSTSRSITGVGFQPDLVWWKDRSSGSQNNVLVDAVRGYGTSAYRQLYSNQTTAEQSDASNSGQGPYYGNIQTLDSDGFTIGGTSVDAINKSSDAYVAWNWKANGAGSSNTQGSITSTVSANTTAGFSIVTYTGTGANATVGHGLGVAPSMIIVKQRDATTDWYVYHSALAATDFVRLNLSSAKGTNTGLWNSTAPTSTVFSLGGYTEVDANTKTYVAYCFAPVAGYSAFGSYTGNGSSDGPFVYTGFRPAWLLLKNTSVSDWVLLDNKRNTYNVENLWLYPNASNAEAVVDSADFLSNGFKLRYPGGTALNTNGNTYLYAAFAEFPFKYTLAR